MNKLPEEECALLLKELTGKLEEGRILLRKVSEKNREILKKHKVQQKIVTISKATINPASIFDFEKEILLKNCVNF